MTNGRQNRIYIPKATKEEPSKDDSPFCLKVHFSL
nr:MAG TPA: hypothetical protein [Bacteriophage sp.]